MQLLTALAGAGAFSGAAVADEEEDRQAENQGGEEEEEEEENPAPPVGTEQLLNYVAAKYGDILSESDVESLQEDVAGNIRNAQAIDGVDLENGDDMALVFEAYRGSY